MMIAQPLFTSAEMQRTSTKPPYLFLIMDAILYISLAKKVKNDEFGLLLGPVKREATGAVCWGTNRPTAPGVRRQ